jgi:hypothetical protein
MPTNRRRYNFLATAAAVLLLVICVVPTVALAKPCYDLFDGSYIGDYDDCPSDTFTDEDHGSVTTFVGLLNRVNRVLNTIVPFLVGIAVFIIIWGIFKYIASAAEEEKRAEARLFIVWGIIGIFAMVSVWGFVNIMVNSFNLSTRAPSVRPNLPPIPGAN